MLPTLWCRFSDVGVCGHPTNSKHFFFQNCLIGSRDMLNEMKAEYFGKTVKNEEWSKSAILNLLESY